MKKLVIELCCVIALAACGNGKEQKTLEEDATAKALLQGVWINDETELPLMRIEGDTIYYADPQNIPVSFKIIRDTMYVYGNHTVTYKIDRQTEYSFWFHSLADEIIKQGSGSHTHYGSGEKGQRSDVQRHTLPGICVRQPFDNESRPLILFRGWHQRGQCLL